MRLATLLVVASFTVLQATYANAAESRPPLQPDNPQTQEAVRQHTVPEPQVSPLYSLGGAALTLGGTALITGILVAAVGGALTLLWPRSQPAFGSVRPFSSETPEMARQRTQVSAAMVPVGVGLALVGAVLGGAGALVGAWLVAHQG